MLTPSFQRSRAAVVLLARFARRRAALVRPLQSGVDKADALLPEVAGSPPRSRIGARAAFLDRDALLQFVDVEVDRVVDVVAVPLSLTATATLDVVDKSLTTTPTTSGRRGPRRRRRLRSRRRRPARPVAQSAEKLRRC